MKGLFYIRPEVGQWHISTTKAIQCSAKEGFSILDILKRFRVLG